MTYTKEYFEWQQPMGEFGGKAELFKFSPYISPVDRVLDFGCGGGHLLMNLNCSEKAGIEINETAIQYATSRGLTVFSSISDVPDGFASVVISNHALEHVRQPLDTIEALLSKMQSNGKLVFVVPHQGARERFNVNDRNQHLYTWNRQTLGNLFRIAGCRIISVSNIQHKWPRGYSTLHTALGPEGFHQLCRIYAFLRNNYQVRVVAEKQ